MMAPTPRFTLGIPKFKSKGGKNAPNTPKNIPQVYKTSGLKLSTKNGKVMIHTKISAPNAIYLLRLVVDSSSPTRLVAKMVKIGRASCRERGYDTVRAGASDLHYARQRAGNRSGR